LIIAAFPGCGKSTLVQKRPDIADSDSSTFDKAEFPANYIAHIKARYDAGLTTLVSTHKTVRAALVEAELPFLLVYPARQCKDEYVQRYLDRGGFNGGAGFAKLISDNWDQWITECSEQQDCIKRVLQPGEFLSDALGLS
jgi:hypothetical protein